MSEWFERSNRPTTDEGYADYARKLLARIANRFGNGRKRKRPPIVNILQAREVGRIHAEQFSRASLAALMVSRTYCYAESHMSKGRLLIEKNILVMSNERKVYDLERCQQLCTIKMLDRREIIKSCLYIDYFTASNNIANRNLQTRNWLILLTHFDQIVFVNVMDGTAAAIFALPSNFRYRRMCWCGSLKVFAVFGETKSTQIVSQSMCRQHVVALFSVHPIAYKGCFFLDKKLYGDANELGIFSEILVVFSMRPRQIVGYNIKDFPLQCKVQFLENNGEPREVLVSDSSINNHELNPQKYFSIDGCWNSIEATMTDTIYLLRSAKKQDAIVIGDWATRQIHIPFELKNSANLSIQTMDEHVFLHSDGSGRILVVEGPFLACYYLLRTAKDQLTYKQQWRTRLWVDADFFNQFSQETELRSKSGRRITLTPPEFSKDDRLTLVEMHFDVDNRMIYAVCTCDMNSPVFDDANCQSTEMSRRNRSEDRGALVYILDDCDGEIINVIMQRSDVFEVMFMKFTTSGITAAIGTKGRGGAFVEVQQLSEMGVRNWRDNKRTKRKIHVK